MIAELQAIDVPIRIAGNSSLDFINTRHYKTETWDFLESYEALLAWNMATGLIDEDEAAELLALSKQYPSETASVFKEAQSLRDLLHQIFLALIQDKIPQAESLAGLNQLLQESLKHRSLQWSEAGMEWKWDRGSVESLQRVLWGIVLESSELLTSASLGQARECPNCGWLFLDTSRNRQRRWCSMEVCGSQVKSRRQYERNKGAK